MTIYFSGIVPSAKVSDQAPRKVITQVSTDMTTRVLMVHRQEAADHGEGE